MAESAASCETGRSVVEIARAPLFFKHAKALSQADNTRGVLTVASQWGVMALAAAVAIYSENWLVYPFAMVVIASRQHALGVLMHDASHYKLFSNRTVNEVIGNILCALPVGMTVARYRADHFRHHIAPNTDRDPYMAIFKQNPRSWHWPKPQRQAYGVLARDLAGLNVPDLMRETADWGPWMNHFSTRLRPPPLSLSERATVYSFFGVVLAIVAVSGGWLEFLLLWALPFTTVAPLLIRIRSLGEHFGLPGEGNEATRHVDGTWYERWLFSPLNANHHLTHHLFPTVPWFNLPKMTSVLFADPEFARAAHRSTTYLGMMRDEMILERLNAARRLRAQAEPRSAELA